MEMLSSPDKSGTGSLLQLLDCLRPELSGVASVACLKLSALGCQGITCMLGQKHLGQSVLGGLELVGIPYSTGSWLGAVLGTSLTYYPALGLPKPFQQPS